MARTPGPSSVRSGRRLARATVLVVLAATACGSSGRAAVSMADDVARTFGRNADDVSRWMDDAARASGSSREEIGEVLLAEGSVGARSRVATLAEEYDVDLDAVVTDAVCGALDEVADSGDITVETFAAAVEGGVTGWLPDAASFAYDVAQLVAEPGEPDELDLTELWLAQIDMCPLG